MRVTLDLRYAGLLTQLSEDPEELTTADRRPFPADEQVRTVRLRPFPHIRLDRSHLILGQRLPVADAAFLQL